MSNTSPTNPWHTSSVEEVFATLGTTVSGLASAEAAKRLLEHGPNELQASERTPAWRTLLAQFQNALILILLGATLISGSSVTRSKPWSSRSSCFLPCCSVSFRNIARNGRWTPCGAWRRRRHACFATGSKSRRARPRPGAGRCRPAARPATACPADARVTQAINLAVDEAALTGESAAVEKTIARFRMPACPLATGRTWRMRGTLVARGRGQAVVVATGMSDRVRPHRARWWRSVEAGRTPLQENLDRLGATLGQGGARGGRAVVVALGLRAACRSIDMFLFGIALAVAVVPEALPAVVTISLAIGVRRMVKRNALVRRLPIVETLGSTSVICYGQDRHADEERDDRPAGVGRRRSSSSCRAPATTPPAASLKAAVSSSRRRSRASCCAPACSRRMRGSSRATAAGMSRAIPPKARSSSRRPKRG